MSQLVINILDKALKSKGNKLKKTNEYMWWSPFVSHHKPKLQVNIETGKWHCWVSNQGGHNLFQLLKQVNANRSLFKELSDAVGSTYYTSDKKDVKDIVLNLPKEAKPLWNGGDSLQKLHALKFIYERGLTDEDILRYNLHYCLSGVYQNRIIIPSYDDNGLLNYFVGRSFMGDNMKYKNPNVSRDIIPFDWFIAWSQPIILCEGVFDAISIRTNAIPMLSKKPSKSLLRKVFEKKVKTVYIALDDDAKKDAYRLSEFFKDFGIDSKVVNLPVDKDPNDLGWERITTLIDSTESASFSDSIQAKLYG